MAENEVTVPQPRARLVVTSEANMMDTAKFEHLGRVARVMADSGMMPESLTHYGKADNRQPLEDRVVFARAFLIAAQADRWQMDPTADMGCCAFIHGQLSYEGKLVAAVIEARLNTRLRYEFGCWNPKRLQCDVGMEAEGNMLAIRVSGVLPGETAPVSIDGYVGTPEAGWHTGSRGPWNNPLNWRRQLRYRGSRDWANAYAPGLILGVQTDDDLDAIMSRVATIEPDIRPTDVASAAFGGGGLVMEQKPQGERQGGRKRAPAVDASKATVASATGASTGSAQVGAEPTQTESSEPFAPGQEPVEMDPSPAETETSVDGSAAAAADDASVPADKQKPADPSWNQDAFMAIYTSYLSRLSESESWLQIKPAVVAFWAAAPFALAPMDFRNQALSLAVARAFELRDPVTPESDPTFFRLWLRWQKLNASPSKPIDVFRQLCRASSYTRLNDAQKNQIGEELRIFSATE